LTKSYVLGLGGEQVSEINGSGAWQHTNIYAGGKLIASYHDSQTYFDLDDWLGTKRAEYGASNGCLSTYFSLPYGDGLATASSTCPTDATEQHFTGKERDSESGNDYFGARYYASSMGRFMSPDPGPFIWRDPQTLNRYTYTRDNPLKYVDPTGKYFVISTSDPHYQQFVSAISKMLATPVGRAAVHRIAADPRPAFYQSGKLPQDPNKPNIRHVGDTAVIETVQTDASGVKHGVASGVVITIDFSQLPGNKDQTGAHTVEHETSHGDDGLGAGSSFDDAKGAAVRGDAESIPGSGDTTGGTADQFAKDVDQQSADNPRSDSSDQEARSLVKEGQQQCQENKCNTTSGNTR
jgi:RHS repeat-associated protein